MDQALLPLLAVLASVAVRCIALAETIVRLRWQERQQHAYGSCLTALARTLPHGCHLGEVRATSGELHLVITHLDQPTAKAS